MPAEDRVGSHNGGQFEQCIPAEGRNSALRDLSFDVFKAATMEFTDEFE
jgi:hypothetical protein